MTRRIVLRIRPDGKVVTDYQGFVGDECFAEAAKLKRRLAEKGIRYEEEKVETKPEAYTAAEARADGRFTGW